MLSSHPLTTRCTAFSGDRLIAAGPLRHVALVAWQARHADPHLPVLVFDDADQQPIEIDLGGSMADLVQRLAATPDTGMADPAVAEAAAAQADATPGKRPRGRPKLGVVAREVTLLPRHWQWLNAQPGGASVALRKLVEAARRDGGGDDKRRRQEGVYRFMHAIAGNAPGFEEAARALFAGDLGRFEDAIAGWPQDVGEHATMLAARALRD
jgi:hypothetical protein